MLVDKELVRWAGPVEKYLPGVHAGGAEQGSERAVPLFATRS